MVRCSLLNSELNRTLAGNGVSTHQPEHLPSHLKAAFLYSSAAKFCAKLIFPVCLEEIIEILSDDQAASPIQEPLSD